jgi:Right handed beta helix region
MRFGQIAVVVGIFSALAGGVAVVPASAATDLSCGSTVTANSEIVLTHDLDCSGTAIVINPPGHGYVHIDLNGHRIQGDGTGSGISIDRHSEKVDLLVYDGVLSGFEQAFEDGTGYAGGNKLTVERIRLTDNGRWLSNSFSNIKVLHSTIVDSGSGGSGHDTRGIVVADTLLVRSNVVSLTEGNTYLHGDTFVGGGFRAGDLSGVSVVGNTFVNCGVAISVGSGSGSRIRYNRFVRCMTGVSVSTYIGKVEIVGNTFAGNRQAGVSLSGWGSPGASSVTDNLFLDNAGDGLFGSAVTDTTVARNRAFGNGGHGINVTGATDGGGNVAHGNRTPPDCVGVVCQPT